MAPERASVYPRRNTRGETISWIADVQWGRGPTARRVRRSRSTESAAAALKDEMVRARDAGLRADVYDLTVTDLLERYIGAKATGTAGCKPWAPSTQRTQERHALRHILPALHDRRLCELTAEDCTFVIDRARGSDDHPRAAIPQHVYRLLTQALRWARREKLILSVAFLEDVHAPHYAPQPRREFTGDEVRRLIAAALERPDAALWLLMLERGLRGGEVRGLLRPHIDRAGMLVKLTHIVEPTDDGPRLARRLKTKNSQRDVPISPLHLELLERQLAHLAELRARAGAAWREHGLVFPADQGQPMDIVTLPRRWRALLHAAGITDYAPPHVCRHTAISRMLRSIPITEVAAIVGDTPATILKTYAHARIDTARAALAGLDARQG